MPARNEADHIAGALDALAAAAQRVSGPVHLIVVDDRSTDATAAIVDRLLGAWPRGRAERLQGPAAGSGPARRAGLEAVLAGASECDLVATTDADTRVPSDWIAVMHALLDGGAQVLAGDVQLEPSADLRLRDARAQRIARRLVAVRHEDPDAAHPHFAGANLGFLAGTLRELGRLPAPRALEDDALRDAVRRRGLPVTRSGRFAVTTSARTLGRADTGLATALAADARRLGIEPAGA